MDERISKVLKALESNNMDAFYAETAAEAKAKALSLIKEGMTVAHGGSVTLKETGILDAVSCGNYNFLDRGKAKTPEELKNIYRKCFSADVYLSSANAITENGELYNVDGNSNRVACIVYGPRQVIMIVGVNKIVKDIDEAIYRVKTVCAPMNTQRLDVKTPCNKTGKCISLSKENPYLCDGCGGDNRICCNYVVSAKQRHKNRIKLIIVNENLGY